jgi:hypothetical protein
LVICSFPSSSFRLNCVGDGRWAVFIFFIIIRSCPKYVPVTAKR